MNAYVSARFDSVDSAETAARSIKTRVKGIARMEVIGGSTGNGNPGNPRTVLFPASDPQANAFWPLKEKFLYGRHDGEWASAFSLDQGFFEPAMRRESVLRIEIPPQYAEDAARQLRSAGGLCVSVS